MTTSELLVRTSVVQRAGELKDLVRRQKRQILKLMVLSDFFFLQISAGSRGPPLLSISASSFFASAAQRSSASDQP